MAGVSTTVSNLGTTLPQPLGSADTIVASLQPIIPGFSAAKMAPAVALVRSAAETGRIPDYAEKSCATGSKGLGTGTQLGLATAQAGLQAGLGAVKIGTQALNAIPILGSLISTAVSFIAAPFQHHAQAVATEQATLCAAVPDAQNFLAQVDQYVESGQWDHVTAVQQMEAGFTSWRIEVKGILQDVGKCNAACVYEKAFRAAIEKRKLDYQQIESTLSLGSKSLAGVAASVTGAVGGLMAFLKKESGAVVSGDYKPILYGVFILASLIVSGAYIARSRRVVA
ncbi:MAG: hypothetical protein ACREQ5_07780 [Candidatus Dormibacteria bacterium]